MYILIYLTVYTTFIWWKWKKKEKDEDSEKVVKEG
jgi:nicotinamide riboside transporter PnuC